MTEKEILFQKDYSVQGDAVISAISIRDGYCDLKLQIIQFIVPGITL